MTNAWPTQVANALFVNEIVMLWLCLSKILSQLYQHVIYVKFSYNLVQT